MFQIYNPNSFLTRLFQKNVEKILILANSPGFEREKNRIYLAKYSKEREMIIKFTESTDPAEIISLSAIKDFVRISGTDDDSLLEAFRSAAIQHVENHCNIHLGQVSGKAFLDGFFNSRFPIGKIQAISSVIYKDITETTQTLPSGKYRYDIESDVARIEFIDPPSVYEDGFNLVEIAIEIGYPVASIPAPILAAIRLLVSHYYDNRNVMTAGRNIGEIPFSVSALLNPYRNL